MCIRDRSLCLFVFLLFSLWPGHWWVVDFLGQAFGLKPIKFFGWSVLVILCTMDDVSDIHRELVCIVGETVGPQRWHHSVKTSVNCCSSYCSRCDRPLHNRVWTLMISSNWWSLYTELFTGLHLGTCLTGWVVLLTCRLGVVFGPTNLLSDHRVLSQMANDHLLLLARSCGTVFCMTLNLLLHWQCFGENWKHVFLQSYSNIIM